jgi:hypothetical protein
MLKHEGILFVMYDLLSFYVHLLLTVITCKVCTFKFGILLVCDIGYCISRPVRRIIILSLEIL